MYKYVSNDGLAKSNDYRFVETWNNIVNEREQKTRDFCNRLKANGIKALHPDDGWVDRKENTIFFCYPSFREKIEVGDKIALGNYEKYRIVEVTEIIPQKVYINDEEYRYRFKDIGVINERNKV